MDFQSNRRLSKCCDTLNFSSGNDGVAGGGTKKSRSDSAARNEHVAKVMRRQIKKGISMQPWHGTMT